MDRIKTRISGLKATISKAPDGALFSKDRRHRFLLWRTWGGPENLMLFVGLNPSVADEQTDDPTIRRIIGFARREQASGVLVANVFSYCATDPGDLKAAKIPVMAENDQWLCAANTLTTTTVVCWGNHGGYRNRSGEVLPGIGSAVCFGQTKTGEPKHPLYLKSDTALRRMVE